MSLMGIDVGTTGCKVVAFDEAGAILALVTMNSVDVKPLTLVPLVYNGQFMMRPGPMFAILTLITLPVILVYYLMQRFMVSGLTARAVRG